MFIEFDEEEKIKDDDQKRNEFETINLSKEKK